MRKSLVSFAGIVGAIAAITASTGCAVDGRNPAEVPVNCTAARADSTLIATDTVNGRVLRVWYIEQTPQTCTIT